MIDRLSPFALGEVAPAAHEAVINQIELAFEKRDALGMVLDPRRYRRPETVKP